MVDEENYIEDGDNDDGDNDDGVVDDNDYGFVFDEFGNIKYFFMPDVFNQSPPEIVCKILQLLGIDDPNAVFFDFDSENTTIH